MRPRRPSELLTIALAMVAACAFVLGLRDLAVPPPQLLAATFKASEPIRISGLERRGSVRVTVLTESGVALAGATVQVFWEHEARFFWAGAEATDGLGTAVLRDLPEGRAWLLAEAPGFARSSSALLLGIEPRAARLTLPTARVLAVSVHDEAGLPIARATVLVETADPLPFGALSDERGVAKLARLGSPPWSVKASAPGYETVSQSGVRGALTLTLRRLASLEVAVLGIDGQPAPGATLMIAGATLWPARSATADARGKARVAGLLAGSYDLRASLGGAVSPTLLGFELGRGVNGAVSLRLEPGRTVVAWVTDGEGASPLVVPNADVVLAEGGVSSFPIRGRTGTDGKVSLGPIAAGPATLGARAEDFVGSALVAVPEVASRAVRISLLRGATLRGDVSDARGFPVDGATIEVVGSDASGLPIAETPALVGFRQNHFAWSLPGPLPLLPAGELGVMPGPVPPIPKPGVEPGFTGNMGAFSEPAVDPAPWISDRGGHFTARPITPGRVRVLVRHPDYVEGTSELVTVVPGGEAVLKIVLTKGGSLEGRVVDERDQAVAGAAVELSSGSATRTELFTTASDGSFAFAAVPSEVTLSLGRPGEPARVVLRKSLHVAEGEKVNLSLVLPAVRDAVRIVVLDEDERPIELVEIGISSLEPTRTLRVTRFTDAEGAVTIEDALSENLRVVAEAPGFARSVATLPAAPKAIKLILKRGVIVEGRVTVARGRSVVVGAVVTLQQEGMRKVATTDADGVFRIRDIAPGEIHVRVEHPEFADEERTLRVDATGRADRAFGLPDMELSEAGEVEGEVIDEHGARVSGASVTVGDRSGYLPAGRPARGVVLSDADGHFLLRGVHPGTALISAQSAAAHGSARALEVRSGRTTRGLRIQLSTASVEDPSLATGNVAVALGERGVPPDLEVVVMGVAEASEAERAGLRAGDVLNAVDGLRPSSMMEARARLSGPTGTDLVLEVGRDGKAMRFRLLREETHH